MRELRDLSKLPADPDYWVELEARVQERAVGAVGAVGPGWWAPLASRALGLGGLAIAAGIAALLLVPPRTRVSAAPQSGLLRLPDDPAMIAFLSAPAPPPLASFIILESRSKP